MIRFPLNATTRSCGGDIPPRPGVRQIGIFDDHGYWVHFPGQGLLQWDYTPENLVLATKVVSCLNVAYYLGREAAQANVRKALGIVQREEEDEHQ